MVAGGPAFTNMSVIWNSFTSNIGAGISYSSIIGLFLLGPITYLVWKNQGAGAASAFLLVGLLIITGMGFFPAWVKLLVYTLVAFLGVRFYVKATEGT